MNYCLSIFHRIVCRSSIELEDWMISFSINWVWQQILCHRFSIWVSWEKMRRFLSRQRASIETVNKVNRCAFPAPMSSKLRFQLSHASIPRLKNLLQYSSLIILFQKFHFHFTISKHVHNRFRLVMASQTIWIWVMFLLYLSSFMTNINWRSFHKHVVLTGNCPSEDGTISHWNINRFI